MLENAVFPHQKTKEIVIFGLSIALVFVATGFINLRLPIMAQGGLIHLGNVPLFLSAFLFGKKTGAIAGAFGMALFDIFAGWTVWAPFTFIIVGLMGYICGAIGKKGNNRISYYVLAILAALVIKIVGYYIAEAVLYGNWIAPAASIFGNVLQVGIAGLVAVPITGRIAKTIQNKRSHTLCIK